MGDDPYDFDIAIPSGKAAAGAKGKPSAWNAGRRGASDDSDASGSSGGGGSESGGGSDFSLSDSEDFRGKKKSKAPTAREGGGGGVPASARGGGGAGSSALDKAKSFLSKYSTKPTAGSSATATKAASSARSRRLEMSLDDEDFSLDSSGEEIKKPKGKPAASSKTRLTRKQSSESEQDKEEEEEESYTKPTPVPAVAKSRYEDSDDDVDDRPQPVAQRVDAKPSIAPVANRYESEDEESGAPVPVRVTTSTTSYGAPQAKRVIQDDDDDEDVESIASQSEMEASVDVPKPTVTPVRLQPTPVTTQNVAKPRQISAMSESGVYEEEDFEDDSVQATLPSMENSESVKANVALSRPREEESNFDYSLDFAEDQESASMPVPVSSGVTPVIREEDHDEREEQRSRSTSSSSSVSNRNSYVDDGDDDDEEGVPQYQEDSQPEESRTDNPTVLAANMAATEEHASTVLQDSENYSQDYGFESQSVVIATPQTEEAPKPAERRVPASTIDEHLTNDPPSTASSPQTTTTFKSQAHQQSASVKVPTQTRPRVVIVREYETNASNVEKRDASTQFTGNHAGIQTDLIPDGMFSSAERKDPVNCSPVEHQQPHGIPPYPTRANSSVAPPAPSIPQPQPSMPGPPPSPFATYGLYDPLQLPVATSMSIYKQQLMALQQQIQQKKAETERLFRDRIASRYSSLRGTDKFLAANRPTRMPLWEALLRVDPTLDERRAKEIASLAGNAAQ